MDARAGSDAAVSSRTGTATASLRRALWASLGVALVVAAESTPRSLELSFPPVFVAYEVLIFAIIPAVVTLGIVAVAAIAWNASLPMWLTSAIAAFTTATWLVFVMRSPTGLAYGLLFGLGGACAGAALGARWRLPVRLVVAAAIMASALLVGLRSVPSP